MSSHPRIALGASSAITLWVLLANPAVAMDPVCKQLKSTVDALRTVPFHLYSTMTEDVSDPGMAKAAGQIGIGGTKQSEEVSTGKDIYVMTRGRWVDMQTSFAAMEADKDTDPDTQKAMEDSRCKALADESMYGQQASVYVESNPSLGTETKIWISKATHLPIRTDITNSQGPLKSKTVSRYEYGGVQAPQNAVTMKDMVKSHSGK